MAVGNSAVVKHLKQDIEHIRVGFFHLVEQHHGIGLSANGLGKLTALVIAHIAGRRSDKAGYGVFLHVFRHIYTNHIVFVVEQTLRKGFCKLGFAHAGGPQEQEAADRSVRVGNAGSGAQNSLRYLFNRFVLSYNSLVNYLRKVEQLFALALHELGNGNTRPFCHNGGDFLLGHGVVNKGVLPALLALLFSFGKAFFKGGQVGIFELCSLFVLIMQLCLLNIRVHLLNFGFKALYLVHALLFGFPTGLHLVELVFVLGKLRAQLLKAFLGELVGLLFKRHFFDFKLHYLTANVVKLRRHGVNVRANGGAGLVHKVDGLIRKETVGDVTVGKGSRRHKGAVVNTNAVIDLIALFKTAQN